MLQLYNVEKYDEDLFTILFDFVKKIKIGKIGIDLFLLVSSEDKKNICTKIEDKITRSIFSYNVSCFI